MRAVLRWMPGLLLLGGGLAQAHACSGGTVWLDADADGRRGAAERGLAGVRVTDGSVIASTDADGRWRLPASGDAPVSLIKPAGYALPSRGDGLPDFWRVAGAAGDDCDFALLPARGSTGSALEVLVFADPQTGSQGQVGYYDKDIVAPLRGQSRAALGVTLGDVVDDVPELYPALNAATASLEVPWLHVAGNHDVDPEAQDDAQSLHSYRASYGPDTFAWEEPQAVFVGLDDVVHRPDGTPGYVGGLREDQFAFLERYLPTVDRTRLLVLMLHIPLFDTAPEPGVDTFRPQDRTRLFALLREFPRLLVLSGHRHTLQHHFHGAAEGWQGRSPLHEFNVGAASGAFWSGIATDGVPDATMADGTPNGYARLRVDADGDYALSWHPARLPADDPASTPAMRLHAPKLLRRGAYPAWAVYANVYMGLEDTRVEYRVDDGDWRPLRKRVAPDPWLTVENARDDLADAPRGYDRSPEAVPSTHLWRGALPTDLAPGTHRVEVRAFDRWQGEQRAATTYHLLELEQPLP